MAQSPNPRLDETLAVNGLAVSKNFSEWFGSSKVVDQDGNPTVVFHASGFGFKGDSFEHQDAKNASMGFHFGTLTAAHERIVQSSNLLTNKPKKAAKDGVEISVLPVFLAISNPVRAVDHGAWHDPEWVCVSLSGAVPFNVLDASQKGLKTRSEKRLAIMSTLESLGYDGIVYENKYEDVGSDSWIAFRPDQVKSAVGNCGLFVKGNASMTDANVAEMIALANEASAFVSKGKKNHAKP